MFSIKLKPDNAKAENRYQNIVEVNQFSDCIEPTSPFEKNISLN